MILLYSSCNIALSAFGHISYSSNHFQTDDIHLCCRPDWTDPGINPLDAGQIFFLFFYAFEAFISPLSRTLAWCTLPSPRQKRVSRSGAKKPRNTDLYMFYVSFFKSRSHFSIAYISEDGAGDKRYEPHGNTSESRGFKPKPNCLMHGVSTFYERNERSRQVADCLFSKTTKPVMKVKVKVPAKSLISERGNFPHNTHTKVLFLFLIFIVWRHRKIAP